MKNLVLEKYEALAGSHLSIPKDWGIIFGEGFRLFGGGGRHLGFNSSDIGYVNDIFMGGIIYIGILYGTILRFLLRKPTINHFTSKIDYNLHMLISDYS